MRNPPGHISSRSLEVGFLTWADQQRAVGYVPVSFSVPPVDGICNCCDTAGDLYRAFVIAAGAAGCGVVGTAGATGGLTVNNAGKASGVAGATTGVLGVMFNGI